VNIGPYLFRTKKSEGGHSLSKAFTLAYCYMYLLLLIKIWMIITGYQYTCK